MGRTVNRIFDSREMVGSNFQIMFEEKGKKWERVVS
jgi:hypothetical protein